MISHTALFATAVSLFVSALLGVATVAFRRARRFAGDPSLHDLLAQLSVIDRHNVALVARSLDDHAAEPGADAALEPWQVWELMGGLEGLEALARNCEVLIRLAFHVQQWYPEALPVAEQLRLNAREIEWHLERLRGAESRGNLRTAFPDYAQRAATIYHGMTQHVLALYEVSQVPGFAELEAVL